jgi:hypothetical protein
MPRLQGVAILSARVGDPVLYIESCLRFYKIHGRGLHYLQLRGYMIGPHTSGIQFTTCSKCLSCTETFGPRAVGIKNALTLLTSLEHPTLVWIDVWKCAPRLNLPLAATESFL